MSVDVGPLDPADEELAAVAFALNQRAFDTPPDAGERWIASLGHSHCVGAWSGGRLVGFGRVKPYAQWYGGRPVPMAGVASVAVAPERRGEGVAGRITAALVAVAREAGLPVSVLFPASTALYRRWGWEVAGHHTWLRVPARALRAAGRPAGVSLRPAVEADSDAILACYTETCRQSNGLLDRTGPFFEPPAVRIAEGSVTVAEVGGRVAGYVVARLGPGTGHRLDLTCWDVVGTTAPAQQACWWVLGSHASVADSVDVRAAPDDGLVLHLPEPEVSIGSDERWMARIVDAPLAMAARGWPAGVTVSVDLALSDPVAPWQEGDWRLTVAAGAATLSPGGAGTVRLGPGALAALYSSYADPWSLRRAGLLDCADEAALAALRTAFAGPTPHLLDYF